MLKITTLLHMDPLKIDRTKLITPSEYAKKYGITRGTVSKMMDAERVTVIKIKGGRLILED